MEKFFDNVNQSKLMEILARDIKDGRVLSLIHKYLRAGAVWCGRFEDTEVGVPQGGPLDLKRYVVGWVNYYKLADMGAYLHSIDEWMRRRIRMVF